MKLGELFFNLSFNADTMKLKDFGRAVSDLNMTSILTLGSFGALYEGAKKIIDITQSMGEGVANVSEVMDVNSESLQKWQGVATSAGVSTQAVTNAITDLQTATDNLNGGDPSKVNALYTYFLSAKELSDKTEDAAVKYTHLIQNAQKMFATQPGRVRQLFSALGIDESTIRILKEIQDIPKALNNQKIIPKDDIELINKNFELMGETSRIINLTWAQLGTSILPSVNSGLKDINDLIVKMGDSKLIKDLLWLTEHGLIGTIKNAEFVGGGLEKLYRYASPETYKELKNGTLSMGPSGLDELANTGWKHKETNVTQHNNITVQGSNDPEATAKAIDERIGKHINQAISSGSTGGW